MLTFGGEQVALPFVEHAEDAPSPALTLDLLTEAFANLGEAEAGKPDQAAGRGAPVRQRLLPHRKPRRPRRRRPSALRRRRRHAQLTPRRCAAAAARRNRSASRAQGAANETSVEHREATRPAAAGSVHEAKAPAAARPASIPAGNEPIILGVGVPASEL